MKKFIINSVTIFLFFLEIFNVDFVVAQKIVCEVENKYGTTRLFLMKYDDDDMKEGFVWSYIFWQTSKLSDNEKQFLEQIEGKTVNEEDNQYDQILRLSNDLHEIGYHPAMGYIPPIIENMNMNMFEILRSLLGNNQ